MNSLIDRNNFTPIYYQLGEMIKEKVRKGLLNPGEQLPPEEKLALEYEVSRKTVRQTLSKLSKEGYVYRQKGKGTFIDSRFNRHKVISLIISDSVYGHYHRTINDLIGGAVLSICSFGCEIRVNTYEQIPQIIDQCKAGQADIRGFIFIRYSDQMRKYLEIVNRAGLPVILEGMESPNNSYVDIDNESPMKDAVKYLTDLGHNKIGILSLPCQKTSHFQLRLKAASTAVKEMSATCEDSWSYKFSSIEVDDIREEAKEILSSLELPSAFICVSDSIAIGLIKAANEIGIAVPDDFSVIGFDDILGVDLLTPSLTTFKQDYYHMGQMAAQKLIDMLDDYKNKKQQLKIGPKLIIRNSCAPPKKKRK